MSWANDRQATLDRLRKKELAGTLTGPEQAELAALVAQVEAEDAQVLAPAMDHLCAGVGAFEQELCELQGENEALARY